MPQRILITGGAGFIGSHVADVLLRRGHTVRAFDSLSPQVHGPVCRRPDYLDPEVELVVGDLLDRDALTRALQHVDAVYHLAAAVGVGQSMYEIERYVQENAGGTAVLLEALIAQPVERLIVASSMSIYGEGLYRGPDGAIVPGRERTPAQLRARRWELVDESGRPLEPLPTPESKPPALASIYALSKYDQERMCLLIGRAYSIPTVALRFFNVYGPRQALSNPYTGVLAIFASRLLNGKPPLVNEDGLQRRDFVSVADVAEACALALEVPDAAGHAINVGSGRAATVLEVGRRLCEALAPGIEPEVTGQFRIGDIRHCYADIALARSLLGYEPRVKLEQGIVELAESIRGQIAHDKVEEARDELTRRGLAS
jgi:dTDP-L-rhamnose 4-epimerase